MVLAQTLHLALLLPSEVSDKYSSPQLALGLEVPHNHLPEKTQQVYVGLLDTREKVSLGEAVRPGLG